MNPGTSMVVESNTEIPGDDDRKMARSMVDLDYIKRIRVERDFAQKPKK